MAVVPNRRNHYRILHVQPDAPAAVLKSSYRALMLSLDKHPDRGGDHWDAALINEAYRVLSDPERRAEYDRQLALADSRLGEAAVRRPTATRAPLRTSRAVCSAGPTRAVAASARSATLCAECRSPLTPAGAPHLEESGRRAARRVAGEGAIHYFVRWPQSTPDRGRIVDVSPRGMQFIASAPIQQFHIIKLSGALLDAVGRVASCVDRDGSYAVGVEFYTVGFHPARGTFLSMRA